MEGPKVLLDEALGRPIALALNELATNALKYGSLSGEEGNRRFALAGVRRGRGTSARPLIGTGAAVLS